MNKLVKGNLVSGLPSKIFNNDHYCVACQKGKHHKATYWKGSRGNIAIPELYSKIELQKERIRLLLRALVIKTQNKTPYELLNGRTPRLDFIRPFGCLITILNTLDPLRKFEGKADEGFLVGYSVTSKAFREVSDQHYIVLSLWSSISSINKSSNDKPADDKPKDDTSSKTVEELLNKENQAYRDELDRLISQEKEASDAAEALRKEFEQGCMDRRGVTQAGSTNSFNIVSNLVNVTSTSGNFSVGKPSSPHLDAFIPANTLLHVDQDDFQIPDLEETDELQSTGVFNSAYDDDLDKFDSPVQSVGAEADFNNMESSTIISHIPTHRVHLDHPKDQMLGDLNSAVQTRRMAKKSSRAHAFLIYIHNQRRTNHKDYENCLFACFFSKMEPKKVYKNKKDERCIVVRNKARLVTQGHIQEEGIDYDEVFAPMAKIEAIRIFLAFASSMGFIVYQMDVKSAFLYGTIEEEVYVSQPLGFIDPQFPNKVYKMDVKSAFLYDTIEEEVYISQPPGFIDL
uniref:Reverse transcriptase Ty1/copia-type domain-containing protein n=1 Tax=Tanacetum cinerariifolium TaxID=118510 RepID=A0A699K2V6_TANCI|nr:hypothetical protein [Tanacetum cinerariifolium]